MVFASGDYIGPVFIEYGGVDYGLTVDGVEWEFIKEKTDIMADQAGGSAYDKVTTSEGYLIRVNFIDVTNDLIAAIDQSITVSGSGNALKMGCSLFKSDYANNTDQLKIIKPSTLNCAVPSTDPDDRVLFLKASPTITAPLTFDASTQRNLSVEFFCFKDRIYNIFGFSGTQTSNSISGIVEK